MDFLQCNYDKHHKIWSTPSVESIYNHECALGKIVFSVMRSYPNQIIQIDDANQTKLTNREAVTWGIRFALHLKKLGLRQDDIVGISARNSTYVLPTVLGCLFNCTTFHAVNPTYDPDTLSHCFGLTKPKVIFCDGCDYDKMRKSTKSFKAQIYTLTDRIEGVPHILDLLEPSKMEFFYQPEKQILGADQTVAILCSSGTTGKPKAVCLSNSALLFDASIFNCDAVILLFSGADWITGLAYLIGNCLIGATRVITNKPFSCDYVVDVVQKYKVTSLFLPPRHIVALVDHPRVTKDALKSINLVNCGGGAISEKTLLRFKDLLNSQAIITIGYAFTEFSGVSLNFGLTKIQSVGKLLPNLKLRIVDDGGKNLGPNEVGEILLHKQQAWNGYFGNPIETQRMRDAHGWYHSGDLGYMDDDHYLFIVGRKKQIMKYQGFHFWPKEIEDAIAELPDVVETCVVGIYDETKGDLAGALVEKSKKSKLTEQDIIKHVAKRLVAPHKQLNAGVYFVDAIPHNPNGKISPIDAKSLFQSLGERNGVC